MIKYTEQKYITKQELIYRETKDIKKKWNEIIKYRLSKKVEVDLPAKDKKRFWFVISQEMEKKINKINKILKKDFIQNVEMYLDKRVTSRTKKEAAINEAFYSSTIEGAFSSKDRIEDIIKNREEPMNKSEKMIINNYEAIKFMEKKNQHNLDHEFIWELHKLITKDTLDEKHTSEKYREEMTYVWDQKGEVIWTPIAQENLKEYMDEYVNFYNSSADFYIFINYAILHYYFMYIHPFFDGNGRTGRALAKMYLSKSGLGILNYISISEVIETKRKKYYSKIKDSQNRYNDITYFILFILDLIEEELKKIEKDILEKNIVKFIISKIKKEKIHLSQRALEYLKKLKRRKNKEFAIEDYSKVMKVSRETARKDILELFDKGIVKKEKVGKKYNYFLNYDLLR